MNAVADDLLGRLTAVASETVFGDLPADAVAATQAFLLDTLAVGVAGARGTLARRDAPYRARVGGWRDGPPAR